MLFINEWFGSCRRTWVICSRYWICSQQSTLRNRWVSILFLFVPGRLFQIGSLRVQNDFRKSKTFLARNLSTTTSTLSSFHKILGSLNSSTQTAWLYTILILILLSRFCSVTWSLKNSYVFIRLVILRIWFLTCKNLGYRCSSSWEVEHYSNGFKLI